MGAGERPWNSRGCHGKLSKRHERVWVVLPVSKLNKLEGKYLKALHQNRLIGTYQGSSRPIVLSSGKATAMWGAWR
jgi:hypothetical protein